jgi:predicted DNA-binding protein YlxM (UPF0122 family)
MLHRKELTRFALISILLLLPASALSQDSLLIRLADENHAKFTYNGNTFSGAGWKMIEQKTRSAGNVLIGEDHFIREIPAFTRAVMQSGRFDNFIIELDPYSSEIIESSLKELTEKERQAFNEEYQSHFSFYALAPEYDLLKTAVRDSINLMGAEQIAKFSDRLIFQHLEDITGNDKAKSIYRRMMGQSAKHFRKFLKDSEHRLYFMRPNFLEQLEKLEALALSEFEQSVIEDMKISRVIYRENDHKKRIQLMKHILMNRIDEWCGDKNLFKYGAVHMPSGESLLSIYDIGNLVLHVSDAQFKDSYHIAVVAKSGMKGAPFPGSPNSEIDSSKGMLSRLAPFFSVVEGNSWYAFDMVPIRNKLKSGDLLVSNKLMERVIKGYDTLVIIPKATAAGF